MSGSLSYAQSTLKTTATLTAACTSATTACDATANSQLKLPAGEYSMASITVHGTFTGVTLFFEFSDDGGTNWYPSTCTRNDASIQEGSEAIADSTNRSWDCGTAAAGIFRIRQHAISTGTVLIAASQSSIQIEPALTVSISTSGGNPCINPQTTLTSSSVTTSGTAAVQVVPLVAGQKVYVCSLTVIGQSGTTPTFSLVTGTGSNCATGQTVTVAAFATTVNTLFSFANPVGVTPAGQALCYLDTGTTPVQSATLTWVQQ